VAHQLSGSVELAVIAFPGSKFKGDIAPALGELVDSGIVTILDLVFVSKGEDGTIVSLELSDLDDDDAGPYMDIDGSVNGLLTEEDLEMAGEALEPGSSAAMIVWENTWSRRLVDAIRNSGGRLVAHDRLDAETVQAALTAATD